MKTNALAPGKIILLGEYAVLEGHIAWVIAVDRYARVFREEKPILSLASKNLNLSWKQGETPPAPLHAAVKLLEKFETKGAFTIDTSELFSQKIKLGLGSSGASLAALCASLVPQKTLWERFQLVREAHLSLQKGIGSGIDVAASTFAGMLAYQIEKKPRHLFASRKCGVALFFVPTRVAASTVDLVRQVKQVSASKIAPSIKALAGAAKNALEAYESGQQSMLLQNFAKGSEALKTLSEVSSAPIWLPIHSKIESLLKPFDSIVKPTGAGGGDLILIATPEDNAQSVLSLLCQHNFSPLALSLDTQGARHASERGFLLEKHKPQKNLLFQKKHPMFVL